MDNQELIIDNGLFSSKTVNFSLSESYETITNYLRTLKEYRDFSQPGSAAWDEYLQEIFHVLGFTTNRLAPRLLALGIMGEQDSLKALVCCIRPGENFTEIIPDLDWDSYLCYAANYWRVTWGILTNGLELKISSFGSLGSQRKYCWCNLDRIIKGENENNFFNLYKVFEIIKNRRIEPRENVPVTPKSSFGRKTQITNEQSVLLKITQGSLNHSYMRVSSFLSFFPADSIGASNANDGTGKTLTLHVDGLALPIETDIASDKKFFRERGWCAEFYRIHALQPGDEVLIERISEYEFRVIPQKKV